MRRRWTMVWLAGAAGIGLAFGSAPLANPGSAASASQRAQVVSSADPTSLPSTSSAGWSAGHRIAGLFGQPTAISCPSDGFCLVATSTGATITYDDGAWQAPHQLTTQSLVSLACLNSVSCVAAPSRGAPYAYSNGSWSHQPMALGPHVVDAVCTSAFLCFEVGREGRGGTYPVMAESPTIVLQSRPRPGGGRYPFMSLSCVEAFCIATDANGGADSAAIEVNAPSSANRFLGYRQVDTAGVPLTQVSCAFETTPFCAAVDGVGRAFIYAGHTWSHAARLANAGRSPMFVSCTTATVCMAVNAVGRAFAYQNGSWSPAGRVPVGSNRQRYTDAVTGVSCATPAFCMAVSRRGFAYTFTNSRAAGTPSTNYQQGWNSFVEYGVGDTLPTCTYHGDYTTDLDTTRGCADAERAAEQAAATGTPPPTTFGP